MQGSSLRGLLAGLCLLSFWLTGCAAFHPVEGVPARYLPSEMKVGERTGRRTIDLSLLRQTPQTHRVDSGDVLAIYIEGFVGRSTDPPPVFFPTNNELPPSFGLPYPVREDGTISLPQVGSINLRGLTIAQAEERVKQAYLTPRELIHPDNHRVQVNLQRSRQHRVLVIRQDSRSEPIADAGLGTFNLGMVKRGTGKVVSLPAYNNDVLNALTATDGLPGLDAENAVYIIRNRGQRLGGTLDQQWPTDLDPTLLLRQGARVNGPVVRGQSPVEGPRYGHSSPLDRSYGDRPRENDSPFRGDISSGPLHQPMRHSPAGSPVVSAYYESGFGRAIDQAHWTGHSGEQGDSARPLPLPGNSYHDAGTSGILPVAAWSDASASQRYGNPFATNVAVPDWPNRNETAVETRPLAPLGMSAPDVSQPWLDPAAQARASQLAHNDAWSIQPAPVVQTASQQLMPGPATPYARPYTAEAMPQGMSPNAAGPSGFGAPQYHDPTALSGPSAHSGPAGMSSPPIATGHSEANDLGLNGRHVIRIPIRLGPGETADIREEDIILQDGDIVFIESRDTEVFFTGGLLGGGQFTLPRDYDLDILQALSLATSRGGTGGARTVGGVSALNNDVSISPSTVIVLRKLPDGGEVPIKVDLYRARTDLSERIVIQPGDYILLQFTPLEAVAAFLERHLLEGALFGIASQGFGQGN